MMNGLRSIWTEILNLDTIADDDNFLDLGGDSIAAMLCLNRIRARFGVDIPMTVFLAEDMTLRKLASEIDGATRVERLA